MDDAAIAEAIDVGHQVEFDLMQGQKSVLKTLIATSRREAIQAVRALVNAPADNPELIRDLQFHVKRYAGLPEWVRQALARAEEAMTFVEPDEMVAINKLLSKPAQELNDA